MWSRRRIHKSCAVIMHTRVKTQDKTVHNKMMKVIQEAVEHEQTETRSSIWDTEVKSLFPNIRQQGDVQARGGVKAHHSGVRKKSLSYGTGK